MSACTAGAQASGQKSSELKVLTPSSSTRINELVRGQQWKQLAALTAQLRQTDANNPNLLYWEGIAHLQLHEPVAAVQSLRTAEKLGLNTALSHEGLGLAYYDLNQFRLFEEQMKRAAALDMQDAKPDYYMGLYRWSIRSDASGALTFFESAIRLEPNDWKSLYQAGNCLEQLGKLNDAQDKYRQAIALLEKSGAPFGWPYQGMARLSLEEDPNSALDFAKKAVEREPEEPSNHLTLATVYERMRNLPEAVREAEIAAEKNPNDSKTRYTLYKLYRRVDDPRTASQLKLFEQTKALYDKD